jgi:hypothetical protein
MTVGLDELCGQFEQVLLATLVPQSFFHLHGEADGDGLFADGKHEDASSGSTQTAALFTQAFTEALERAGGFGLGRELYRTLSKASAS